MRTGMNNYYNYFQWFKEFKCSNYCSKSRNLVNKNLISLSARKRTGNLVATAQSLQNQFAG